MKKPKWRKVKGEWRRGVLSTFTYFDWTGATYYDACAFDGMDKITVEDWCTTPEAAMKAADAWWERTRKRMEGK